MVLKTLPADQELEVGASNPPLRQIRDTWPLAPGISLWIHPNRSPFGHIIEVQGDIAVIEPTSGKEGTFRIQQKLLKDAWIPQ